MWKSVDGRRLLTLIGCAALVVATTAPPVRAQQVSQEAPRMTLAEFQKRLAAGDAIVLDVRGPDAYREGHIPGAAMVQLDQISVKAADYRSAKKPIVVYCAWANEHTSAGAVLTMRGMGVKNAYALLGGWSAWVLNKGAIIKGNKPK